MRGSASNTRLTLPAVLLCLCSCGSEGGTEVQTLRVVRVSPEPATPDAVGRLFLNQELTVYFNQPINPHWVTSEAFHVLDDAGHPVPGGLRSGSHSVTFRPVPPFEPDLMDGSFKPDREYRLVVSGYPQYVNTIKSEKGSILPKTLFRRYRTVAAEPDLEGFTSPMLPVGTGVEPFLLRNSAEALPVPVGDPRVRLHFTLPVLPTSLSPEAFNMLLLRDTKPVGIAPRELRIISFPPPVDEYPGCTVELELGSQVRIKDTGETFALEAGDLLYVGLTTGDQALVDYRDRQVQMSEPWQYFQFVHGDRVPLLEWPADDHADAQAYVGDDPLLPGFEVLRDGSIRPRVKVEAGSGELGVFRPRQDVVLDPDLPFRRADGVEVRIDGRAYPFLAVDIPAGVEVTVAGEDVRILASGSIRIDGVLRVPGTGDDRVPFRTGETVPPATLLAGSTVALVAGGDIRVYGRIVTGARPAVESSPVTLLAGGRIELGGPIPPRTVLAVEPGLPRTSGLSRTWGPAQQPVTVVTSMTPGVPPGRPLYASGWTDWQRPLPGSGRLLQIRIRENEGVDVAYQTASPDPVRETVPDATLPPPHAARDGTVMQVPNEGFVRFFLRATVTSGSPLPLIRGLSIVGQ